MMTLIGAGLGAMAALGLLTATFATPLLRRRSLADRVAPHLRDAPSSSRLLGSTGPVAPTSTLRQLIEPIMHDAVHLLDKIVGGQTSVRRRLAALGSHGTVETFRTEQVTWGALGGIAGIGIALVSILGGHSNPVLLLIVVVTSIVGGVLARDWWLTQAVAKRNAEIVSEFPVIAEMLALAVTAGETPTAAIARVCRLTEGHLSVQLGAILADTRAGTPLQRALVDARNRTQVPALARFLDGMAVSIERGTPLAGVLHAQAADVRALGKRQLLEAGGKKEVLMMVPVVFCIMPVTILFAFFPGIIAITTVAN